MVCLSVFLQNDGLSGFLQRALADFYAMVRAQTLASGGNTILSFQIAQLQLADSYNQVRFLGSSVADVSTHDLRWCFARHDYAVVFV